MSWTRLDSLIGEICDRERYSNLVLVLARTLGRGQEPVVHKPPIQGLDRALELGTTHYMPCGVLSTSAWSPVAASQTCPDCKRYDKPEDKARDCVFTALQWVRDFGRRLGEEGARKRLGHACAAYEWYRGSARAGGDLVRPFVKWFGMVPESYMEEMVRLYRL